jgi:hypothetical protein
LKQKEYIFYFLKSLDSGQKRAADEKKKPPAKRTKLNDKCPFGVPDPDHSHWCHDVWPTKRLYYGFGIAKTVYGDYNCARKQDIRVLYSETRNELMFHAIADGWATAKRFTHTLHKKKEHFRLLKNVKIKDDVIPTVYVSEKAIAMPDDDCQGHKFVLVLDEF